LAFSGTVEPLTPPPTGEFAELTVVAKYKVLQQPDLDSYVQQQQGNSVIFEGPLEGL
jgi:hypothetical protein